MKPSLFNGTAVAFVAALVCGIFLWILHGEIEASKAALSTSHSGVFDVTSIEAWRAKQRDTAVLLQELQDHADEQKPRAAPAQRSAPSPRELVAELTGADVDRHYSALFAQLKLDGSQLRALREILAGRAVGMLANGPPQIDGQSTPENIEAFETASDEEVRKVIGDGGYVQFQEFERQLPSRNLIDDLQNHLTVRGNALTSEQSSHLLATLQYGSPDNLSGGVPDAFNRRGAVEGTSEALLSDAVMNQAAQFLDADQLSELRRIRALQSAESDLNRAIATAYKAIP